MSPEEDMRYRFLQGIHDKAIDLIAEVQSGAERNGYGDMFVIEQSLAMVRDYCRRELGDHAEYELRGKGPRA